LPGIAVARMRVRIGPGLMRAISSTAALLALYGRFN
jgi:hypothetical protein